MAMPIRAFWLLNGNIRRIRATQDIRDLMTAISAQSAEGAKELQERLVLEIGEVYKGPPQQLQVERDEEGFNELRSMAAMM
jgi:hypothetical protein